MTDIVWEEPPPAVWRERGIFPAIAAELRQHPKRWARVFTGGNRGSAYSIAYTITHGTRAGFREGKWEAVARPFGDDGDWAVFARYLGEGEENR